jgi:hypothetical protein
VATIPGRVPLAIMPLLLGSILFVGCEGPSASSLPEEPSFSAGPVERVLVVEDDVLLEHPCTGELIEMTMTVQFLFFTAENAAGGQLAWTQANIMEGVGIGQETGVEYRWHTVLREQLRLTPSPHGGVQQTALFRASGVISTPGERPFKALILILVATNAHGEVTAEFELRSDPCPSNGDPTDPVDPVPPPPVEP